MDRNTTVVVSGSYNSIELTMSSHTMVRLNVTGDHNEISVHDGYVNLVMTGDNNTVRMFESIFVTRTVTGANNVLHRTSADVARFTVIMSLNGYNNSREKEYPWPVMNVEWGENVTIHVVNDDVQAHGLAIFRYFDQGIAVQPGQSYDVKFAADRLGEFRVYCNIFCTVHVFMQSGLVKVR